MNHQVSKMTSWTMHSSYGSESDSPYIPTCDESSFFDEPFVKNEGAIDDSWNYQASEDSNQSSRSNSMDEPLVPDLTELQSADPMIGANLILGNQVDTYGWQKKNPQFWDRYDVALWIQCKAAESPQELANVHCEAFAGIDGQKMCTMQPEDFQQRDPCYGLRLFVAFNQVLCTTQQYQEPFINPPHAPLTNYEVPESQYINSLERYINNISFDRNDKFPSLPTFEESFFRNPPPRSMVKMEPSARLNPKREPEESYEGPPSPSTSEASSTDSTTAIAPSKSRRGRSKGKLWEFVLNLLLDTKTNPSIIKWEDRSNGVFRIVRSDQVAKLWGARKSNPSMTYEKMSRAMRYYYRKNILERIDGRRLVYKFGHSSRGWQL